MPRFAAVFLGGLMSFVGSVGLAHSGGTDSCGTHVNGETNERHVHSEKLSAACEQGSGPPTTSRASAPRSSAGGTANESGASLEARIENELARLGFELIPARDWKESRLYREPELRAAVLDTPYLSIYGHRARIEFRLIAGLRQVLVEAKRQSVPGSIDEKLPYIYLTTLKNIEESGVEFVLVMEGDGWKPQAREWIRAKADQTQGFYVFSPGEFAAWVRGWASARSE